MRIRFSYVGLHQLQPCMHAHLLTLCVNDSAMHDESLYLDAAVGLQNAACAPPRVRQLQHCRDCHLQHLSYRLGPQCRRNSNKRACTRCFYKRERTYTCQARSIFTNRRRERVENVLGDASQGARTHANHAASSSLGCSSCSRNRRRACSSLAGRASTCQARSIFSIFTSSSNRRRACSSENAR